MVANADEMEPGTFKDRFLMEGDPHQLIEGIDLWRPMPSRPMSPTFSCAANTSLRQERLAQAIAEAYAAGYLGKDILGSGYGLELYLHVSAGRYMCGEETGLLNALEGKRANPRAKPPFPQVSGPLGQAHHRQQRRDPGNVPHIINKGAAWFQGLSRTEDGGTKLYGASGKVKRPGLWELPMGTTLREILEEHAGGMRDGVRFRGVLPGGASTDFLVEEASRRSDGFHGSAKGGQPPGNRHHDRARRPDLPGRHGFESRAFLCSGVLRLVHAMLERPALGGANPGGDGGRPRETGRPGEACLPDEVLVARAHLLRAGAGRRRTPRKAR